MSSARKRQRAMRTNTLIANANQKAMTERHHANIMTSIAEEAARRHDAMVAEIKEKSDEITRLRAEVQHWKANHDNRVEAARVLIERHDLPFDRIPAYKHYLHM